MTLVESPPLLILGTKQEYINRIRQEYDSSITTPEGCEVVFYIDSDKQCGHFICGKKGGEMNPLRAQRILLIRFILENQNVRTIVKSVGNGNIIFCCEELSYIVCNSIGSRKLKCFTQYVLPKKQIKKFSDTAKYQPYII